MARKNKIDEAFEELEAAEGDEDAELDEGSEDEEDEGEDFEDEELTDEDVEAEVARLDEEQRLAIQRTRKAGKATRGRREARQGRQQREARDAGRDEFVWTETSSLDAPPPRPGMEQRWIRVTVGAENDPRNVSRKRREKWVPRQIDTVPEGFAPPTISHSSLGSVISVLDLVLCERPAGIGAARRKHFAGKTERQQDAAEHRHVDKAERFGGPGVRRVSRRAKPTVGVGRRVAVQED